MNFYLVIPAHNEEAFLAKTLESLTKQTLLPKKIVVVDDNSTDGTQEIIRLYTNEYTFIHTVSTSSEKEHAPGSKVINAFYEGLDSLDSDYDVLCKFDADLIFPSNYLEQIANQFNKNKRCGMVGGFCYVEKNGSWIEEGLTNIDHIRGALKAYRKECFTQIGGLKRAMGWDTVDELLAKYHGWEVITDSSLQVKHLKPTGANYSNKSKLMQGQAFKRMRYGFILTVIASLKLAIKKKSLPYLWHALRGFFSKNNTYIVSEEEGKFIRRLRWNAIKKKIS